MPPSPQQTTQYIVKLINEQQFQQANSLLSPLIKSNVNNVQLWHLQSIIFHGLARHKDCEKALTKALAINPNYIPSLNNLATLYKQQHKVDAAIKVYKKILTTAPNDINTLFNVGVLLNGQSQFEQAKNVLAKALTLNSKDVNILIALGQSNLHLDNFDDAKTHFQSALNLQSNNIAALNNLGLVLKKQCLFKDAISTFRKALTFAPAKPELLKNLASCYTLTGEISKSKQLYQQIIEQSPLDLDAHHWLNQMLWEHQDESFLHSYHLALKTNQGNPNLQLALAHKLRQSGEDSKAKDILEGILKANKKHVPSLLEVADIYRQDGDFEQSLKCLTLANKQENSNPEVKQELAKSFISINQPKSALSLLNKLLKQEPYHQGYWAYKTTALRLQNSAEYDYLCDYDKFILKAFIDIPKGYSDLNVFNQELSEALKTIHYGKSHPLDQTLISGSQTGEKLFDYHLPIINEIKQSLQQQTKEFLAQLPKDPKHPMLSRNTLNFVETDSWSVILNNSGFHKNHYHPAGWYSSCYYVKVPSLVSSTNTKQGWINFGQPGFNHQSQLSAEISVQPKEGLIVQFPSYFWHGTNPFSSEEKRITTPYDILPI
ncbi:putative 2OG-Fe(II) oxygenase [Thalassotalea nanhaiensis]|uniref:2OG-Fe(II) oxygenase n=1 Tax=Thalassotalea nanhaiensis TaxID=3065648 RepID=A0ABY9TPL0_9GAMM|nr:putative 2OG-Fe(II) oxygenase [Colwelliaceae bacterium SQ345]